MGVISEIKDLTAMIRGMGSAKGLADAGVILAWDRNRRSIAKRSQDSVLQFPVIASRSLDIDTMQIISKSLERTYSTFVQTAISMDAVIDTAKHAKVSPKDIVRQFHTNIMQQRSFSHELMVDVANLYNASTESMNALNKRMLMTIEESLNMKSLNSIYTPVISYKYNFKDPKLNQKYNALREAKAEDLALKPNQKETLSGKMLQDNDVKKSNELMATTLHVRFKLINSETGESPGVVDFLIGVKAILHPVSSQEMVIQLAECYRNNSKVFQFLRWTTGEISFVKDLVLALDDTKRSVIDESTQGVSPWWSYLKRVRDTSKVRALMGKSLIPNVTIVLTREEAEVIREKYGYDLTKAEAARTIMEKYFLLGFVIVDTSTQSAAFLYDGRVDYETVSFSGLEKENTASERKFKEMLKAVNRM